MPLHGHRTLDIIGAPGVGKATLIGNMMFKYGGIDLMTMQEFEKEGIRTYDRACEKLKGLPTPLNFDTPEYHVTLLDGQPAEADCVIFVVAPDFLPQAEKDYGIWTRLTHAKELILLVNKMDVFAWSQEQFGKAVQECTAFLQDRGIDATRVPIIPLSAINGDNMVQLSPRCSWYNGWVKHGHGEPRSGTTLLEALDISFRAE